jgi:hypothetical protein
MSVVDDWEDDWETSEVPDLRNIEEENKKLLERKLVEDADKELTNDLFNDSEKLLDKINLTSNKIKTTNDKNKLMNDKSKSLKKMNETKKFETERQKEIKKLKKSEKIRETELFGESTTVDEYEEKYGYIEDEYC